METPIGDDEDSHLEISSNVTAGSPSIWRRTKGFGKPPVRCSKHRLGSQGAPHALWHRYEHGHTLEEVGGSLTTRADPADRS